MIGGRVSDSIFGRGRRGDDEREDSESLEDFGGVEAGEGPNTRAPFTTMVSVSWLCLKDVFGVELLDSVFFGVAKLKRSSGNGANFSGRGRGFSARTSFACADLASGVPFLVNVESRDGVELVLWLLMGDGFVSDEASGFRRR